MMNGNIVVVMMIALLCIGTAKAYPLEVSIEEKVNTTVDTRATGTGIDVTYLTNVTGFVNITNRGSDTLYDIWVALELKNNTSNSCILHFENASSDVSIDQALTIPSRISSVLNREGANCFVHIPLLKPGELVSVFYDVDDSAMKIANSAPFVIDESYDPPKIPAGGKYTWKVYFNVSLNETWWQNTALGSLTGNNVLLNITKYLSNDSSNFGSPNWRALGPISDPSANGFPWELWNGPYTANDNDALNITGINLNLSSKNVNITFQVTGNYTNSSSAPWYFEPFGFAVLSFSLDYFGNISGTKVVDVFAIGNATINATKSGPNETNYWFGNATITNTASGLTYTLTNVTMWATGSLGGGVIPGSYEEWTPGVTLNPGDSWNTSQGTPQGISFQYNAVPIIWANATFKLVKGNGGWEFVGSRTVNDTNVTYGSNFIVIEKIYIIGTYLIKVTKHVMFNRTEVANNIFDVYLVVENLGGNESPYIYVYDLIPQNFAEYNWNNLWNDIWSTNYVNKSSMLEGNGSIDNPMSGYVRGHYWKLYPVQPNANGDGNYQDWSEIESKSSVVIFYQIYGSGDFKVLDALIVGIDPIYSLNEQTAPRIVILGGAKATSYEVLATLITGVIMVAGFVVNRRSR